MSSALRTPAGMEAVANRSAGSEGLAGPMPVTRQAAMLGALERAEALRQAMMLR